MKLLCLPPPRSAVRGGKWLALAASIYIQCTSGSSYCFGIYSSLLKNSQAYDQFTLDSVAFSKDFGANVGVLSGILSSSSRVGAPWVVLLAGSVLCFSGYFPIWLAVTGAVPRPPLLVMCLSMLLAAQAQTFFNTADVVTAVENFPGNRGTVIGIMKGFLGLSSAILTQIYRTLYNGNAGAFVLMLACLPALLPLLLMYFVKIHQTDGRDDKKHLDAFSIITLIIAGYLMLVILGENILTLETSVRIVAFLLLLLLLMSPLIVAMKAQLHDWKTLSESCDESIRPLIGDINYAVTDLKSDGLVEEEASSSVIGRESSSQDMCQASREDLSVLQSMLTSEFWLLFLAVACGLGSGLATINNISQIGSSLGYSIKEISSLVSLWSIWNFLGRFAIGYISDYFLRSRGYARTLFMVLTLAVMSIGHVIISSGLPGTLYLGSTFVGLCYGSIWVLMPSITSEIFGLRDFGTIFNTIAIASPVGSYILSVRVVGYIYDKESSSSAIHACMGRHCFMSSFLIMASTSLLGVASSVALFLRTRKFYSQVIYAAVQSS
ncbi:protein NUCLEAR FUSION DEFECTIVE 4-like isoform X1 [Dioscorea cayenensis subsp. rotundata]|uniref:Protein NUCLEAR FUSION DEFECTIVE 4-like isoform X1 n=1 Tax=Dioscorea cayennensis subsp. rotundata TaxID=55577 RepID=A0AB40BVB0_DIOCR|nr:protein NUCLEAR FUSION DEFECTIVE 4-like isoform X1 [Dioscorea cayenensis subsp. rotundata]